MWDDIIIGEGEKHCSAVKCKQISRIDISENRSAYWVTGAFLSVGMTVYKDSIEGKVMAKLIKDESDDKLLRYIDSLVFKHLDVEELKILIESYGETCYRNGEAAKLKEIKTVLQL